jgi:hypothetical protein
MLLDFDFDMADVLSNVECPISTPPLSKDGSTTYLKDLNRAMKLLLNFCKQEGHLNSYWLTVQKDNEIARKCARTVYVDMKRIELGSAFDSDPEDYKLNSDVEDESDWSITTSSDESSEKTEREDHDATPNLPNDDRSPTKSKLTNGDDSDSATPSFININSFSRSFTNNTKKGSKKRAAAFNPIRFLA